MPQPNSGQNKPKAAAIYSEAEVVFKVYFNKVIDNRNVGNEYGTFISVYKTFGGFAGAEIIRKYYQIFIPAYVYKPENFAKYSKKGTMLILKGKVRTATKNDLEMGTPSINFDKVESFFYDSNNDKPAKEIGLNSGSSIQAPQQPIQQQNGYQNQQQQYQNPAPVYQQNQAPTNHQSMQDSDPFGDDIPF